MASSLSGPGTDAPSLEQLSPTVDSGYNLAVLVFFDKYRKEGGDIQELAVIRDDAHRMQKLLTEKFGYKIPSEDPTIFEPQSFENPRHLVKTFEEFLKKWKLDQPKGTIVDHFLLYYHGH